MIVSRTAELGRIDRLLAGLLSGHGGALVVHGEAGIGKTTLRDAQAGFERLGATAWAAQTRTQLVAAPAREDALSDRK